LTLTAWAASWSGTGNSWGGTPNADVTKIIGIDPTGATDVWASTVIWSAENHVGLDWTQLTVTVDAKGNGATVFLRAHNLYPFQRNAVFWDEIRLTMDTTPAQPAAAPTPQPAVNDQPQ